jgi:hypothetical protein
MMTEPQSGERWPQTCNVWPLTFTATPCRRIQIGFLYGNSCPVSLPNLLRTLISYLKGQVSGTRTKQKHHLAPSKYDGMKEWGGPTGAGG